MRKRFICVSVIFNVLLSVMMLPRAFNVAVAYGTVRIHGQTATEGEITFVGEGSRYVARIGRNGQYWLMLPSGRHLVQVNSPNEGALDADSDVVLSGGLNVLGFDCNTRAR